MRTAVSYCEAITTIIIAYLVADMAGTLAESIAAQGPLKLPKEGAVTTIRSVLLDSQVGYCLLCYQVEDLVVVDLVVTLREWARRHHISGCNEDN